VEPGVPNPLAAARTDPDPLSTPVTGANRVAPLSVLKTQTPEYSGDFKVAEGVGFVPKITICQVNFVCFFKHSSVFLKIPLNSPLLFTASSLTVEEKNSAQCHAAAYKKPLARLRYLAGHFQERQWNSQSWLTHPASAELSDF
jgi:hypothetical protein